MLLVDQYVQATSCMALLIAVFDAISEAAVCMPGLEMQSQAVVRPSWSETVSNIG